MQDCSTNDWRFKSDLLIAECDGRQGFGNSEYDIGKQTKDGICECTVMGVSEGQVRVFSMENTRVAACMNSPRNIHRVTVVGDGIPAEECTRERECTSIEQR